MKYSIIVCAKGDSQRLPGKNIKPLNKKPLIEYTFDFIERNFDTSLKNVWVVTDSSTIQLLANKRGFGVLREPERVKNNNHNMGLMRWIHNVLHADNYIMLPPTSPIRGRCIIDFIEHFLLSPYQSGLTVSSPTRGQYKANGALFMWRSDMLGTNDIIGDSPRLYVDKYHYDINTQDDFDRAEKYLKENGD